MKSIDIKSLIIGALLTSTIFLGVAAAIPKGTGKDFLPNRGVLRTSDQWDDKQVWELKRISLSATEENAKLLTIGHEPFAATDKNIFYRKRIK